MSELVEAQQFFYNRFLEAPVEHNNYTDLSSVNLAPAGHALPLVRTAGEVEAIPLAEAFKSHAGDLNTLFSTLFSRESIPRLRERKHFLFAKSGGNGFFVKVAAGKSAEVEFDCAAVEGGSFFNLFLVGENASLKVIEKVSQPDSLISNELFLSPGTSVEFASIASPPTTGFCFSKRRFFVGAGARASCFSGFLGGGLTVGENEFVLQGREALGRDFQAGFASGKQHFDLSSVIRHEAPYTKAHSVVKSCLKDEGRSVLWGKIVIEKGAKQSDSFLSQNSLLLNSGARSDAMPILEIEENDVRATHASSVSHVDENALFYLGSRGISPPEGKKTIAESFLESAFEKSSQERAASALAEQISLKW